MNYIRTLFVVITCTIYSYGGEGDDQKKVALARGDEVVKISLSHRKKIKEFETRLKNMIFTDDESKELSKSCPDNRSFFRLNGSGAWGAKLLVFGVESEDARVKIMRVAKSELAKTDYRDVVLQFYKEEIFLKQEGDVAGVYKPNILFIEYSWKYPES